MKRNKITARSLRTGTSPYQKYDKAEHRYSAEYYKWFYKTTRKVHRSQKAT